MRIKVIVKLETVSIWDQPVQQKGLGDSRVCSYCHCHLPYMIGTERPASFECRGIMVSCKIHKDIKFAVPHAK